MLHLDRTPGEIDARIDLGHNGREAFVGIGVGGSDGRLPERDLTEIALVDLERELGLAGRSENEERGPGLHDCAVFDVAGDEHAVARRCDRSS